MSFELFFNEKKIFFLGGNWGNGPVDMEYTAADGDDGDDGDGNNNGGEVEDINGFPITCPIIFDHPEFEWPGRGNGTPVSRRIDFENSISGQHISITAHRDPNRPRGRDIEPRIYAQIQDLENKKTCR